jgi:hypothetical protein
VIFVYGMSFRQISPKFRILNSKFYQKRKNGNILTLMNELSDKKRWLIDLNGSILKSGWKIGLINSSSILHYWIYKHTLKLSQNNNFVSHYITKPLSGELLPPVISTPKLLMTGINLHVWRYTSIILMLSNFANKLS